MPATYKDNGGAVNGSNKVFTYDFPVLQTEDVQVALNGATISQAKFTTTLTPAEITFLSTTESDVQEASGAPKTGVTVRVYRKTTVGKTTGDEDPKAVFAAGSSIRAGDLNIDVTQSLYGIHELQDQGILREDLVDDIIDGTKIADGAIADEHIQANAEIQVSKLKDGDARQVLQTAVNGTDVEWTSDIDLPGTLHVTSHGNIGGTLDVTGESTLASATVSDLTSGRIVFTSTGGALVDSANLTFNTTGNGHLKVGVDGGYGTITCATINATYWNGENENAFWKVNRNAIDHYGKDTGSGSTHNPAISLRKDSGNLSSSHTFSIAKDYTFEIGRYENEGLAGGTWYTLHYAPVFRAKQAIEQDRVTNISNNNPGQSSSDYSVFHGFEGCEDEHGEIWIGDGKEGYGYNLTGTTINLGGFTTFDARRNGIWTSNNDPTNPDGYQPVLMLSGQKGAMFVHPDNTSHINDSSNTTSGLRYLAYGAGGHGIRDLGDSYNYGGDGYRSSSECMDLLEAACDVQIIVGGVRAKNKLEIGSSTVTGTLAISGTNVTSTAAELNILDGVTATTAELNLLDGVTATTSELNIVDGITATTAELNNLDGYTGNTSELNILDGVTATTANLNIVAGMTKATSLTTNSDTEYPTSKAVNDRIVAVANALGGFVAIADKDNFPTSHPDPSENAGTVVSISNAAGISVNSSGVGSLATRAGGSDAVVINGFPTALRGGATVGSATNADPYILPSNVGLQVQTTSTAHTYDYHKYLINEEDANKLSGDIQDFQERYRVAASAPSSSLDDGDLWFDTTNNKMKVYNASGTSWDDVATPGNFYINTLSSSGGSGGGSATFNGTATRFTLSNPPTQSAQQCIVSVNGVIQKPNSGTSPSEGFAIDGDDIIFAAAPATNAPYFIITLGNTVSIGTPSDNTVTSAKIVDGSIVNGDISSSAAIEASKLDNPLQFPDSHKVSFGTDGTGDMEIYHDGTDSYITNATNELIFKTGSNFDFQVNDSETAIKATANGAVELYYDNSKKFETTSAGVEVTGTLVFDSSVSGGTIKLEDNQKLFLGGEDDLKIYHDGSNSYLWDTGEGDLHIMASDELKLRSDNIILRSYSNDETFAKFIDDGAVELYHDNSKKFETTSGGGTLTGDWTVTNDLFLNDSGEAVFGTGGDLKIYHSGSHSYLDNNTGSLIIRTNVNADVGGDIFIKPHDNETAIAVIHDGAVELYYDNSKKLETNSAGVEVTGILDFDSSISGGTIKLQDDQKLFSGSEDDLKIYHDGSNSYVKHDGGGSLLLIAEGSGEDVYIRANDDIFIQPQLNENGIKVLGDGAVELYWDGSKKFATASDGATVYGTLAETSDIALKTNIEPISNVLDKIKQITGYTYQFKDTGHNSMGVIAQDVEKVFPELVHGEEGSKTLQYSGLIGALIESVKELSAKVAALEAK